MKHIITLFFSITFIGYGYTQSSGKNVEPIIDGTWLIDFRPPMVSLDNLDTDSEMDSNQEILNNETIEIIFKSGSFNTPNNRKNGTYSFKGSKLYLNSVEYRCAYYSDDKFSLIRTINSSLSNGYMLTRKK